MALLYDPLMDATEAFRYRGELARYNLFHASERVRRAGEGLFDADKSR